MQKLDFDGVTSDHAVSRDADVNWELSGVFVFKVVGDFCHEAHEGPEITTIVSRKPHIRRDDFDQVTDLKFWADAHFSFVTQ